MADKKMFYDSTWQIIELSESHIRAVKEYLRYLENAHKILLASAREGEKEDTRGL